MIKRIILVIISTLVKIKYKLILRDRVSFGSNFKAYINFKLGGPGRFILGDNLNAFSFQEPTTLLTYSKEAMIKIGNNCRLNGFCIQCAQRVELGNEILAGSCLVMDSDFHSLSPERLTGEDTPKTAPVIIGDKVWLAGQSAVLKGVTVGERSIVGFRAVVAKDVPANSLVVGNPAEIIKHLPQDKD